MKKIAFVTTTSTNAAKGGEALKNAGIKSEIRKIQGGTASGCLFGITVDEAVYSAAKNVLQGTKVRVIAERDYPS